jgi:hypothetical protein
MKPTAIVPDAKHAGMFRLKWPDGVLSNDMYNQTRASDILRCYDGYVHLMRQRGNQFWRACRDRRRVT